MACQTRIPTGEKAPPKFVAPSFVPTQTAQTQRFIQSQLNAIAANLSALNASVAPAPQTLPITATEGTVQAREGDTLRLLPTAAGMVVLLPTARAANKGQDVTVLIEQVGGPVTVRAVDALVQGQAEVLLDGLGMRVFRSDGTNGWWIVGQNSANSANQLMAISAGTNLASSGTVVFSNSPTVSFGMDLSGVVTASASTGIGLTGPGATTTVGGLSFSNANNMSWSIAGASSNAIIGRPFVQIRGAASTGGASLAVVSVLSFGNSHNVSWTLTAGTATNASNSATLFASVASSLTAINLSAGTTSANLSAFTLANSNGLSFGLNASVVTASFSTLVFSASNGLTFGTNASTVTASFSTLSFSNANNVTFGIAGSTLTASVTVASTQGSFRVSAGTTNVLASNLSFADPSTGTQNVSFGLNGSTITAAANVALSAGTTSFNRTIFSFADANNVSWGLSTNVGGVARVTASVTVASSQDSIRVSAGTTNVLASALSFANTGAFRFGLNGSTITHDATVSVGQVLGLQVDATASGPAIPLTGVEVGELMRRAGTEVLSLAAGTYNDLAVLSTTYHLFIVITSPGDVTITGFLFGGGGAAHVGAAIKVINATGGGRRVLITHEGAGSTAANRVFTPAGATWELPEANDAVVVSRDSDATGRWRLEARQQLDVAALFPFAAGAGAGTLSVLSFVNGSGVSFGLAGSTITASVRQIGIADTAGTVNNGTVVFTNDTRITNSGSRASIGNVMFDLTGSNMGATAMMGFNLGTNLTQTNVQLASKIHFLNNASIAFTSATTSDANGPMFVVQAFPDTGFNTQNPALSYYAGFIGGVSATQLVAMGSLANNFWVAPFKLAEPFPGPMTVGTAGVLLNALAGTTTSSCGVTARVGFYSLANSTQLSLVNSFSATFSRPAENTTARTALVQGLRFLTAGTGQWSSSPVFSQGVQYWVGMAVQTGNIPVWEGAALERNVFWDSGAAYRIEFGSSVTANASGRFAPFFGVMNTSAPPATIGTNALTVNPGASSGLSPIFEFRNLPR